MAGPAGTFRGRRPLIHHGVELRCGWQYEEEARAKGHAAIAGLDEVGRGALCGPVVACAVVLGEGFDVQGIDDSKRLTCKQREALARRVREASRACCVGIADHREIDRFNILRATYLAMERAVAGLTVGPDLVLVDALTVPRRADAGVGPPVSRLRAGAQHGLRQPAAPRGPAADGADRDPPPLLPRDRALAVLVTRAV